MKVNALILALAVASVSTLGFFAYVMMSQPEPVKPAAITEPEELPLTRENLLKLVNEERAKVGVAPLVIDERLNQSAQMKADDMATYEYFSHTNHDGTQGYEFAAGTMRETCRYVSENITDNIYANNSSRAIRAWIDSKPHHEAMIDAKYSVTGFGFSGTKVVQHFCQVR